MTTLNPTFVSPSEAPHVRDGHSVPSEHAFVCLMSLAATYARHGKLPVAAECMWSAFDTARMLRRPDMCLDALVAMDAITTVIVGGAK